MPSLVLLPVEFVELMLLALISDRPVTTALVAPEYDAFFTADEGATAPEFSFAEAASFAFFCWSHDWSSSSRDRDLFLGCMMRKQSFKPEQTAASLV